MRGSVTPLAASLIFRTFVSIVRLYGEADPSRCGAWIAASSGLT